MTENTVNSESLDSLQSNEFMMEERVVHLGKKRLKKDSIIDKSTSDFKLPAGVDIEDYIVYSSPLSNELGSSVMSRTSSDGRSVGKFIGLIEDSDGHRYCEFQVKGVGVRRDVKVHSIRRSEIRDESNQSKKYLQIFQKNGRQYPTRYETSKVEGVNGKYGFSSDREVTLLEEDTNQYLREAGLRTRRLVLLGELSDEVPLSTASGIQRVSQAKLELGYTPGVEIWAIRSRYRVEDIFTHSLQNISPQINARRDFVDHNKYYELVNVPIEKRVKRLINLSPEKQNKVNTDFLFLAKEILQRAGLDEDDRFVQLAKSFEGQDIATADNQKEFWFHYLRVFSTILGEQVGIMYKKGAFTIGKMLNAQNITLMAEIVDHDVTRIDIMKKSDADAVIQQFTQTIEALSNLATELYSFDLIDEDSNPGQIIELYTKGLISKITDDDLELLKKVISLYMTQNKVSISEFRPYEALGEDMQKSKLLYSRAHDRRNKIEENVVWTMKKQKVDAWALKSDVLGNGDVRAVFDGLLAQ